MMWPKPADTYVKICQLYLRDGGGFAADDINSQVARHEAGNHNESHNIHIIRFVVFCHVVHGTKKT